MAARRTRQSTRKVKNLKVKSLAADKAKQVKGGPISHPDGPREAGGPTLLLPAVRKIRE